MKIRLPLLSFALVVVLVVVGCTPPSPTGPDVQDPPPADPSLQPTGPVTARVGTTIEFAAENIDGTIDWTVDRVLGGNPQIGTVDDGTYTAPARVPEPATVTVGAAAAADATRQVEAEVTITAPGTLYVFEDEIHVYKNLDAVDGNVAPDRSFDIEGLGTFDTYDMAMAPLADAAFFVSGDGPDTIGLSLVRIDDVSSAEGLVEPVPFDTHRYPSTGGVAYDPVRDILYFSLRPAGSPQFGFLVYDGASSATADIKPSRMATYYDPDYRGSTTHARIVIDADADRLFFGRHDGSVLVFDGASALHMSTVPDRRIEPFTGELVAWSLAYDSSRDELYLGSSMPPGAVYVFTDASKVNGSVLPTRIIGGPATGFDSPSQVSYDEANDRLVVVDASAGGTGAVMVFDDASTLTGDVAPSRTLGGSEVPTRMSYGGVIDPTM